MGTATGAGIAAEIRGDPMRPHKSPSKKEAGLDASRHTRVSPGGQGEDFFLDILFHRMSEIAVFDRCDFDRCDKSMSPGLLSRDQQRWRGVPGLGKLRALRMAGFTTRESIGSETLRDALIGFDARVR
jgi:hypothetical protein